ncbi:MAG: mucoidy inhibitor MuiA family protein [Phycisphaerae bacterium]|nr:mucoidy inhibitor MuiA family protein [Phycisphaerae bacterium]
MTRRIILAILVVVLGVNVFAEPEAVSMQGKIEKVIVYQGQALVTRVLETDLKEGSNEIVITGLPNKIVSDSIYAETAGQVTVSSVRYRERAVKEDTREEVRSLDAEIEKLKLEQFKVQRDTQNIVGLYKHYESQWQLSVAGANSDLSRSVLQYEPIKNLTEFLEQKLTELHDKTVQLEFKDKDLTKQLDLLGRKRTELEAGKSKTEREAVLLVKSENGGKAKIELSYLVNEASWFNQYNVRSLSKEKKVFLEYNAVIHQASGEDWNKVAMILSTAQPAMSSSPPELEPMQVQTGTPRLPYVLSEEKVEMQQGMPEGGAYTDITEQYRNLQSERRKMSSKGKAAQMSLNKASISNQMLEFQADKEQIKKIQQEAKRLAQKEGVSVSYDLGEGFTMPSRSDQQLITITSFDAPAEFVHTATPLLTDFVYIVGEITNTSSTVLLPGPVSTYRDGEFAGKASISLVTSGETFAAGFGVDSQVKISREFGDKKVETFWGSRVDTYNYRLAIENYRNEPVTLRLYERMPYTKDASLEIMNFVTDTTLSADADYVRTEKDKGILRWDVTLPVNTSGKKAKIITYSYTMKYDNEKTITPVN